MKVNISFNLNNFFTENVLIANGLDLFQKLQKYLEEGDFFEESELN